MFAEYARAQIKVDERETRGQKSQADPLLKEKSDAERYEETYSDGDENKFFQMILMKSLFLRRKGPTTLQINLLERQPNKIVFLS